MKNRIRPLSLLAPHVSQCVVVTLAIGGGGRGVSEDEWVGWGYIPLFETLEDLAETTKMKDNIYSSRFSFTLLYVSFNISV